MMAVHAAVPGSIAAFHMWILITMTMPVMPASSLCTSCLRPISKNMPSSLIHIASPDWVPLFCEAGILVLGEAILACELRLHGCWGCPFWKVKSHMLFGSFSSFHTQKNTKNKNTNKTPPKQANNNAPPQKKTRKQNQPNKNTNRKPKTDLYSFF